MKPSKYQSDIYHTVQNEDCNLLIQASAGSGKSTTLIGCANIIPEDKTTLFLAFNRSIVQEIKERIRAGVDCSTLHSKGISFLYQNYGKLKVNDLKSLQFSEDYCKKKKQNYKDRFVMQLQIDEILKYTRMSMLEFYTTESVGEVSDIYGLSVDPDVIQGAVEVWAKIDKYNHSKLNKEFHVDFVDMVYLPAALDIKVKNYDYVLVDECQDLSNADIALVNKLRGRKGRFVAVGDPYQNIYLFAGASAQAYNSIALQPNTKTLPLSVTYRCPRRVVQAAKQYCPVIEPREDAQEGEVIWGGSEMIQQGDLVLCRNTKPLVEFYFKLIDRDLKCSIAGKDFETKLKAFVKRYKDYKLETMLLKAQDELNNTEEKLLKRGVAAPEKHKSYTGTMERNEVLFILAQKVQNTADLLDLISRVFSDEKDDIRLMTIHRAKGLEAENVFLLKPELIPSKWAETQLEIAQERNLMFVALTRAKHRFVYLND